MGDDEGGDRDAILARRRRFVAMALGSLTAACGAGQAEPEPCLSQPCCPDEQDEDPEGRDGEPGDPEPEPMPCLSPAHPDEEADGEQGDEGQPVVCLSFDMADQEDG